MPRAVSRKTSKSKKKAPVEKAAPAPKLCKGCQARAAAPDPRAPLENPKQEKFCRNVALLNMPNAKAYRDAFATKGSAHSSAYGTALRKKLEVGNRIITLSEKAVAGDLRTRQWVDDQLKEVVDRCMQKKAVIKNGKIVEYTFDARGANTALQLMGKDRGMFVDKIQIIDDELAGKTPEEVAEVIRAAAIELGRPFIRQLGEAVGLFETDSQTGGGLKTPTVEAVPTVQ
jgi:hypothetical protein